MHAIQCYHWSHYNICGSITTFVCPRVDITAPLRPYAIPRGKPPIELSGVRSTGLNGTYVRSLVPLSGVPEPDTGQQESEKGAEYNNYS